jgi:hypothetical protein
LAGESVTTLISKVGSLFSIPIRFSDRLLIVDAFYRNSRAIWFVVSLLAMITVALLIAHSTLSQKMNFQDKSVPSNFYSQHAIYLWITAAEWFVGISVPLILRTKILTISRNL